MVLKSYWKGESEKTKFQIPLAAGGWCAQTASRKELERQNDYWDTWEDPLPERLSDRSVERGLLGTLMPISVILNAFWKVSTNQPLPPLTSSARNPESFAWSPEEQVQQMLEEVVARLGPNSKLRETQSGTLGFSGSLFLIWRKSLSLDFWPGLSVVPSFKKRKSTSESSVHFFPQTRTKKKSS